MNPFSVLLCFSLLLVSSQTTTEAVQAKKDGVYIVYMGAAPSATRARRNDHDQLLNSMLKRRKDIVYSYNNGFSGFAARLSDEEARSIAQRPGVVSVFPDPLLQLHTTRSWDFLKYQTDVEINLKPISGPDSSSNGEDAIIGILDTGIWPESKSFNDKDMGPIPSKWKGSCMQGSGFTSSNCNRKLIGARYYNDSDSSSGSPRDQNGHGTHVAATAAGSPVEGASYRGLAEGIAKGGSPGSRIAMYRVCTLYGCRGSGILKAFDDAIADGVDILSLSLGASAGAEPEFSADPIAIGAFHAVEKGILVVCSAGNDGPNLETVVNVAPWILTVAATTIDRQFESDVVLGGSEVIKGGGINFANIQKSPVYPLIYGPSAKDSAASDESGRTCIPGALDKNKVMGKIIVCENYDGGYSPREKLETVISQGGIGVVLIDDNAATVASVYGSSPIATVTRKDGSEIISYINSTRHPTATILPTVTVTKYAPAPSIAYFSGRGPAANTRKLLKPDIAAPGVAILAAWPSNDTGGAETAPPFNILSGTSMSCPHVSGIAATVRSQYPSWSASAIRSAIMTTAIQTNNLKSPITTNSGEPATPYDLGAGEVSTTGPFQPGLVYETEITEYLQFLCNNGYEISKIKLISPDLPSTFSCPSNSSDDLISNMNYPSIAVSNLKVNEWKKVLRTVTSVGEDESVYTATVDAPTGLEVQVRPNKLQFTKNNKKLSYEVAFRPSGAVNGDLFGTISWTNGKYRVRSPFVASQ